MSNQEKCSKLVEVLAELSEKTKADQPEVHLVYSSDPPA